MLHQNSDLESSLLLELFDQERAVLMVVEALSKSFFLEKKALYRALFTFVGIPNSGKHFLAQKLLEYDENLSHIKTFHMDWYAEGENNSNSSAFIETEIREYVTTNPQSLLIFEDIEKAELQVQLTLFALFSDKANSSIDLSQAVIIFTTTRAAPFIFQPDFKSLLASDPMAAHTYLVERLAKEQVVIGGMVEQAFDSKLLSLINQNSVVPFNKLSLTSLIKIGARALHGMSQNFLKQSSISIQYINFDRVASLLTLSLAPFLNAKHIKEKIPEVMFTHIYQGLKLGNEIDEVVCSVSKEAQDFFEEALTDEVRLLKQLRDQRERISLVWDYRLEANHVVCEIKEASYSKQIVKVTTEEGFSASQTTFDDVAGHEKVKKELLEVVTLLKEPKRLEQFSMSLPKGIILHGDAHIGKKMLARAFAKELDMPYITMSQTELFDEQRIAKVYEQARNIAPSIVILEDIDIQGIMGGAISPVAVAPFMAELDALPLSLEPQVFTVATVSIINAAIEPLMAAGYLDMTVEVPKLDMEARRFFIDEVLKMPNDGKIDVEKVVRYISGMDGQELKKIANDTAMYAARKGAKKITQDMLLEQINVIKYGSKLENKQIRDIEKSMESTAYHEAGHAVLSYFLMPKIKIEQVTVAPRNDALGFVSYNNEEFIDTSSKEELFNNVCVLLAGRMVTLHKYDAEGLETGAVNDLEVASMQIYAAIAIFGMDEKIPNISVSGIEIGYNKELFTKQIEERMLVWLEEAKEKTQAEVEKYWNCIDAVAKVLIEKEVIDGFELKEIIEENIPKDA
jgi:cell division protease FtsH